MGPSGGQVGGGAGACAGLPVRNHNDDHDNHDNGRAYNDHDHHHDDHDNHHDHHHHHGSAHHHTGADHDAWWQLIIGWLDAPNWGRVMISPLPTRAARMPEESAHAYGVVRALLAARGVDDGGLENATALDVDPHRGEAAWCALADEAEYHGVSALIEPMITTLARTRPDVVPEDVRRTFVVLVSRHRRAAAAREQCIDDLLTAFAQAGIPIILLKGAALAHLIYPGPALRAMVDIDGLVAADDTERAVSTCRDLGFSFAAQYGSRFAGRLHHLPAATSERSGFRISLEIHTDTMSPDQADSLTFATLTDAPQRFRRGSGPDGIALGHTDMLRHLARHAFEPARRIRLIHLYDLWRYQRLLDGKVDWGDVAARFPEVMTALRLVSYVFADQRPAVDPSRPGGEPAPSGIGLGMVPLSEIATMDGLAAKLAALFDPPAWWLHGYYAVPPERSLLYCRTIRHPTTVARWFTRRLLAGLRHARTNRRPRDHGEGVTRLKP